MKNLIYAIISLLIAWSTVSCDEKLSVDERGILLLNIYNEHTGEPVSNASIIMYNTVDNWAFDQQRLATFISDQNGEVVITDYPEGEYYFDVVKDDMNNWQNPFPHFMENSYINNSFIGISRNINGIVSTTNGRQWAITQVYDENGSDLPLYACLTDNIVTFTKAGAYEMHDMTFDCDSISDFFEASWWGIGDSFMGLIYADVGTTVDLYISELTDNRFVATQFTDTETINYVYERN